MIRIVACLFIIWGASFPFPLVCGAEYLFGDPVNLGAPVNNSQSEFGHLTRDGLSLYVNRGPNFGAPRLYVSHRTNLNDAWGPLSERSSTDSTFGEPTNVGAPVNTRYMETDPSVSADGLVMVFASNRPNGFGGYDLWESRRDSVDASWQEPMNLGEHVNHWFSHTTPALSSDGLSVIYSVEPTSTQFGDLWAATRTDLDSPWSSPVNLGSKINTSQYVEMNPQLSTDGSSLFYSQWTNSQEFDLFEIPILPFEAVALSAGSSAYSQNFDAALGPDGNATGSVLPTGWTVSDRGILFGNATNRSFPVSSTFGSGGNPVLNAGAEGDVDRTLAIGVKAEVEGGFIQLLADVTGEDAASIQIQFDVEAWDARRNSRTDDPGEAAFQVQLDIDRGDGYTTLADLGTVTTGLLATPTDLYLDGNAVKNRVAFDSGRIDSSIPAGSKLRVRWFADRNAQTNNWVFGLDNVELALFNTRLVAGDFNNDDVLNIDDLTTLTNAIETGDDLQFDLDQLGVVDAADRLYWVTELRQTWIGDANLDGVFDSGDMVMIFQAGEYEDEVVNNSTWATGDWNGDGEFDSGDLVTGFQDGGYEQGLRTAVSAVPEPSSAAMLTFALLALCRTKVRFS
jgi:hypothetical protein